MSYPGYPANNQGFPGQPGAQQPGSQPYPPYPPYPDSNTVQQGQWPMPVPMVNPRGQSCYQQQNSYPPGGHYPPQQKPGQFLSQPDQCVPNSHTYPPPLYTPQVSPYPNVQNPSGYPKQTPYPPQTAHPPQNAYPPQTAYPPIQPAVPIYQNIIAGGYGGHSQVPPQTLYPPIGVSAPAHNQQLGTVGQKKSNPTVRPANPFDAEKDAKILRKAMKGFGTDEKAIIQVLANRVNSQRQEIAKQFKTMYGKDLISDLKSELSGKFEDLIVALMTPIHDYLAKELHKAVDGIGTDEEMIIEIMCTASNSDINIIKTSYRNMFRKDLEQDLKDDTSGHFCRLLVSLCQGNRCESLEIDVARAQNDAQTLLKAGEARFGTDESTFNMILCSRSFCQLQRTFMEYHRLTGHDFEDAVKSEFSGDIENGLRAIVKCVKDKSSYFAKRLHETMAGLGTNDSGLIRIVAIRCEIDMADIKNAFKSMYGKTLESFIKGDTSGDYQTCLLALVAGQN